MFRNLRIKDGLRSGRRLFHDNSGMSSNQAECDSPEPKLRPRYAPISPAGRCI